MKLKPMDCSMVLEQDSSHLRLNKRR